MPCPSQPVLASEGEKFSSSSKAYYYNTKLTNPNAMRDKQNDGQGGGSWREADTFVQKIISSW